jgi:hypothetical protein
MDNVNQVVDLLNIYTYGMVVLLLNMEGPDDIPTCFQMWEDDQGKR